MRRSSVLAVLLAAACAPAPGAELAAGAAVGPEPTGANVRIVPVRDGGALLSPEAQDVLCQAIAGEAWPEERGPSRDAFFAACPALTFTTTRRTDSTLYVDRETNLDLGLALRVSVTDGEYGWDGRLVRVWTDANRFAWTASIERRRSEPQTRELAEAIRSLSSESALSVTWGQSMVPSAWGALPPEVREDAELDVRQRHENTATSSWVPAQGGWTIMLDGQLAGFVAAIEDRSTTIGPRGKLLWYDAFGRFVLETDWERQPGR